MTTITCSTRTQFVFRLGRHHFAFLRSLASGLDVVDTARRYLGIEHGNEARAASRQTVEAARAIARRRGERAWHLIGLTIKMQPPSQNRPTLNEFSELRDLDGWSESEVADMYAEAYPSDAKAQKRQRLHDRLMDLLKRLEALDAEQPLASDSVAGWFDSLTSERLIAAGLVNLGELNRAIATRKRWYQGIPAMGVAKASRIVSHLRLLLAAEPVSTVAAFALQPATPPSSAPDSGSRQPHVQQVPFPDSAALQLITTSTEPPPKSLLAAKNDSEAIEAWINARAGSAVTAKSYRREARRLVLWLHHECRAATFGQMSIEDCRAYMTFLQNIPTHWISRVRAMPGEVGWAPFRGRLSQASQRQAIVIVASLFNWLQSCRYLQGDPWVLVNKKTGDEPARKLLDSKALSEIASNEILGFLRDLPPSPSSARMTFILQFMESVGLRSAELIGAKLGDLQLDNGGWLMQVRGKGAKDRLVVIPDQAFQALEKYLAQRGQLGMEVANPGLPLLASLQNQEKPIGYQALYEHVRRWLSRGIAYSALPLKQRQKLQGATTHWLRHTFGTRAVARDVPLDVIQAQLGHASIQTTMNIYGKAPITRRQDELKKAFAGE
jgi:site-specific recombinase XerD